MPVPPPHPYIEVGVGEGEAAGWRVVVVWGKGME